jgi:hypothetical protein
MGLDAIALFSPFLQYLSIDSLFFSYFSLANAGIYYLLRMPLHCWGREGGSRLLLNVFIIPFLDLYSWAMSRFRYS